MDKSWDHPWTTDEMREHRNDWSLAADAGLLKHLQQFSDNLTEQVQNTQEKLNTLSNQLNETTVIIDNITNVSLALANTQFIESRVYEDDVDVKQSDSSEQPKPSEAMSEEDLIASVGESIKQSLTVMDEKFQRLQVIASDSEDEGEVPTPSIILKPKDHYENRPLPYVIGSEKWTASNKIGLESSSSDSEVPDAEEDSASEDDLRRDTSNNRRESLLRRSSSSLSSVASSNRNRNSDIIKNYSSVSSRTEKLETHSQDTLNSGSEIVTPTVGQTVSENSSKGAPSFAEELAKRLGKVLPTDRPIKNSQEADQTSINRFKDDLFAPDDNDVFGPKSDNLFSGSANLFDDDAPNSLWKNQPYKPPRTNIIPASEDVPPPMSAEATKQKSAFDDLCGDGDSEDSDDIFTSKSHSLSRKSTTTTKDDDTRDKKKFLNVALGDNANNNSNNIATSTPELNDNGGLFGDGSEDDDLFGTAIKSTTRNTDRTPETSNKGKLPQPGLSITQADILSSNLGSRLFQRVPPRDSSDSSDAESSVPNPNVRANVALPQESDSSGISDQPNSGNSYSLGVEFKPQFQSTRLASEEIFRERIASDSLYEGGGRPPPRQPETANLTGNNSRTAGSLVDTRIIERLDDNPEEDFDGDDVFGPPPLPTGDSKSAITSNEDLFSNGNSGGSRSQKSFDLLASGDEGRQFDSKITSERSRGLFDEDIDIFGTGDEPEVDIFGEAFKSSLPSKGPDRGAREVEEFDSTVKSSSASSGKKIDFFADTRSDDFLEKSFGKSEAPRLSVKTGSTSIFDDSEDEDYRDGAEDDLFGTSFRAKSRKSTDMSFVDESTIFSSMEKTNEGDTGMLLNGSTKDGPEIAKGNDANESTVGKRQAAKSDSDESTAGRAKSSFSATGGLFDNLEDDTSADDDSLFGSRKKPPTAPKPVKTKDATEEKETTKLFEESAEKGEEKSENVKSSTVSENSKNQEDPEQLNTRKSDASSSVESNVTSGETIKTKVETNEGEEKAEKAEEETSVTDGGKFSRSLGSPVKTDETQAGDSPKILSECSPMASPTDESSQRPKRALSEKMQNLVGKMGNFKPLSPTNKPPTFRKNHDEKSDSTDEATDNSDWDDPKSPGAVDKKSPTFISSRNEISQSPMNFDASEQVQNRAITEPKESNADDGLRSEKTSKSPGSPEKISEVGKRDPPKTLNIRLPMPSAADDPSQRPKRQLSEKIQNLMGKMNHFNPALRSEKSENADDAMEGSDSEDGSFMSAMRAKSPIFASTRNEDSSIFAEARKEDALNSPLDDSGNSESAISFDLPPQIEVLAVEASKSRARIQAKRRPQSRHARHSALRKSGIDFDTVDNLGFEASESDRSDNTTSGFTEKITTVVTESVEIEKKETRIGERLNETTSVEITKSFGEKTSEVSYGFLAPDDKSEMSFSKGSGSLGLNKSTLLSPSTDEEDLFDVPPDLPEDPPKEDTLFGRAPILSPIDSMLKSRGKRVETKSEKHRIVSSESDYSKSEDKNTKSLAFAEESGKERKKEKPSRDEDNPVEGKSDLEKEKNISKKESTKEKPTDPLRDNSHDPLKDPSQLFAFVTKTPSPEKGQGVSFKDDASLFTHVAKKSAKEARAAAQKPVLDLFGDDSSVDLFSGPLGKSSKISAKNPKKHSLFDDMDNDDDAEHDLFGAPRKISSEKSETAAETGKSNALPARDSSNRSSIFEADDDDADLFVKTVEKKHSVDIDSKSSKIAEKSIFSPASKIPKDSKIRDIFGDQSSGDEDIFAKKKTIGSGKIIGASGSIFDGDRDETDADDDIFGKKSSTTKSAKIDASEMRPGTKKNLTRDLKSTAEKIVEDPLSMLQDD